MKISNNNKQKKVLFCTPYDLSNGSGISRCAHHIFNYYNGLKDPKIEIKLFSMDRSRYLEDNSSYFKRLLLGIVDYTKIIWTIKRELCNNIYDVVHIASSASISLFKDYVFLKLLHKKNIESIVHFHFGRIPQLSKMNNWEWKFILKIAKLSTKIIVIDRNSYNILKNNGINNVEYIPNPLSTTTETMVKQNNEIRKENGTILFVGHVIITKGVYELVEACSQIKGINLKIIGLYEKEIKNELLNIFSRANNENSIEFTGNISSENVIKEMLKCDIFVLPTYTEGFPNVILESMACGCSIVTTPVGAIPEMLDINSNEPCGICVPPQNVKKLQETIEYLLDNNDIAKRMGNLAKKRVNNMYAMDKVWLQLCDIWTNTTMK